MVVNSQNLIRAMKSAKSSGGYTVAMHHTSGMITICTEFFCACYEKGQTPRKVLGLIVEHLGELPTPGQAYRVLKKTVQTEIYDVALASWTQARKEAFLSTADTIKRTHFTWKGLQAWQQESDLSILLFDPDVMDVADFLLGQAKIANQTACLQDEVSSAFVIAVDLTGMDDRKAMEHIAGMQWA